MTDDTKQPHLPERVRISDAERERLAGRLQAAVGEGRISFAELDHRLSLLYAARTREQAQAVAADLPSAEAPRSLHLRRVKTFSRIAGPWDVPAVLTVDAYDAVIRLDFRHTSIEHTEVRIELWAHKSVVRLWLPAGSPVSAHELVTHKAWVRNRRAGQPGSPDGVRFTITGELSKAMLSLH
uniref:Uncharacterized protein pnxF n=1 Tax=Streptomyces sp. TA-0256 TaxID=573242 RepID=E5RLL2_9ACTN|nr:hypothetical protein [Streptomyces sp. TA-0256]